MADYTGDVPGQSFVLPRQTPDLTQPTALEQIGAGLQLENTVIGGLTHRVVPPPEEQPFKNEWDVRDVVSFDEFMSGRFDSARDDRQVEAIRDNVRRETRLRDAMERGPLAPIAVGLFAAGVDPFTYLGPFSAPFKTLGVGGRALAGAADATLGIAASEVVLSGQSLRSGSDALASMLMGTVLGAGVSAAMGRPHVSNKEFGTPMVPTARYTSVQNEIAALFDTVARDDGTLARLQDTTAIGRFMDSPTLKWTFDRHPPPPGVIDDANLLRFAMGRSTKLFDEVEAAARKLEALDSPLNLAIERTAPDLTASRLERDGIMRQIVDLEGRDNPAAKAAIAEGKTLDDVLRAMDAAPSARKDPVAMAQAAKLRQRLAELDDVLPLRVADEAGPLTWQVNKAREAAMKEYQDAVAKLQGQLEKERARAAKLTERLGTEGTLEAHAKLMELKDALARGTAVEMPHARWLDDIAASFPEKPKLKETKTFDAKAKAAAEADKAEAAAQGRDKASPNAAAKGESIDFIGLCGGL